MSSSEKNKTLKEEDTVDVMSLFLNSRFENIHTSLPGQIESYEAGERKAKIKLLVNLVRKNGDILPVPVIENVPVMFPSCKSFSLTFPLVKGDKGLVVFAETGIGGYLDSTGTTEVEADSPARFQLTDAIFIPGVYPFSIVPDSAAFIDVDESGVISINGSSKNAAGVDDAINSSSLDDPSFWTWVTSVHSFLVGLGFPVTPPAPTNLTGKISSGTDRVLLP